MPNLYFVVRLCHLAKITHFSVRNKSVLLGKWHGCNNEVVYYRHESSLWAHCLVLSLISKPTESQSVRFPSNKDTTQLSIVVLPSYQNVAEGIWDSLAPQVHFLVNAMISSMALLHPALCCLSNVPKWKTTIYNNLKKQQSRCFAGGLITPSLWKMHFPILYTSWFIKYIYTLQADFI